MFGVMYLSPQGYFPPYHRDGLRSLKPGDIWSSQVSQRHGVEHIYWGFCSFIPLVRMRAKYFSGAYYRSCGGQFLGWSTPVSQQEKTMTGIDWSVIVVAVIGVIGAWLSARSARASAEYSAYSRARKLDVETIERQDAEIAELTKENKELRQKLNKLEYDHYRLQQSFREQQDEIHALKRHVARLSRAEDIRDEQRRFDDRQ